MVGIIHNGDLKFCPYAKKYEKILDECNIQYEILFWNRSGIEYNNDKYVFYNKDSGLGKNKISKAKDFWCFRRWLIKMVNDRKYDKLIVLSTLTGILVQRQLRQVYAQKYIFDIRDYSYERNYLFYLLEKRVIEHAAFTTISSKGFLSFLPANETYVLTHNISECDYNCETNFQIKRSGRINIVWLGMVRYYEQQSLIIKKLSEDGRFSLIFYGTGIQLEKFKNYVKENRLKNVYFYGEYNNEEKSLLLKNADMINNCYSVDIETKYALSNKVYDGIFYHIPQLVEPATFKSELIEKHYLGIALDPQRESFADQLYEYYTTLDEEKFNRSCEEEKRMVLAEEEICIERIQKFVNR